MLVGTTSVLSRENAFTTGLGHRDQSPFFQPLPFLVILPQLEKIQDVLPSRRDEAHFRRGDSRLITPDLWNFQRVLHTLAATQEVPRHTHLHSRGSRRVLPTSRGAPFPPPSSRGGILSLHGRERIPGVPVASQEEALSTGKARGTSGSCHIPRVTRMSPSIPGKPLFPALP